MALMKQRGWIMLKNNSGLEWKREEVCIQASAIDLNSMVPILIFLYLLPLVSQHLRLFVLSFDYLFIFFNFYL